MGATTCFLGVRKSMTKKINKSAAIKELRGAIRGGGNKARGTGRKSKESGEFRRQVKEKMLEEVKEKIIEERRKEKRVPVEIEVKYSTCESFAIDWMMNMSKGGMFIRTLNPLQPGTFLKIYFRIPGTEDEIYAEGVVRWKAEPADPTVLPGMGIEITSIDERSEKLISEYINKVLQKEQSQTEKVSEPRAQPSKRSF